MPERNSLNTSSNTKRPDARHISSPGKTSLILSALVSLALVTACSTATTGEEISLSPEELKDASCVNGWNRFTEGKFEESIKQYQAVLQKDPKSAEAHYGLAICYQAQKKHEEALKEFAKALELNPNHVGCLNDRGNLYDRLGQPSKAVTDYTRALNITPWNASNYNDRAGSYLALGKEDLALEDTADAIVRDGNFANPFYYRGLAYYRKDMYPEALRSLRYALDCEPAFVRAHYAMGNIYRSEKQYRKAIDHYTQALALSPGESYYYVCRADAYDKLGKTQEASLDYQKVLELSPENNTANRWIDKYRYESSLKPLTKAQLFAVACCAVLDHANKDSHDTLLPEIPNAKSKERKVRLLKEWWGVESKKDLYNSLTWIDNGGQRQEFEEIQTALDSNDPEVMKRLAKRLKSSLGDSLFEYRLSVVKKYNNSLGKKSLIGWDYSRYIHLCRWGVQAGYFTEKEAWEKIMPQARKLQTTFDSWEELGNNYLIGREFWNKEASESSAKNSQDIMHWLLTDNDSPWIKIPWETNLDGVASN